MGPGGGQTHGLLTRRLVVALAGCVVLAGLNPVLYHTSWWAASLAGAVAVGLLVSVRVVMARYRRSLDAGGSLPRSIRAWDVGMFLAGLAAGPLAAIPLALEVGSAMVVGVVGLYALSRLLLVALHRTRRRRGDQAESEALASRRAAQEGARGIFYFEEVVLWAMLLFFAWGSLLAPAPLATGLFMAGWWGMIISYAYFVRLL